MYSGFEYVVPLGHMGLLTDRAPGDIPRGALILANNVSFETGAVTKCPGSYIYNNTALGNPIIGLHDWWPDVYTQRLIAVTSNGSIYRDTGDRGFSLNTPINTGFLNLNSNLFFAEGGNEETGFVKKLFLFTGTNQVQVLAGDGTTFRNIESPAADWLTSTATAPVTKFPTFGFVYKSQLWAFLGQNFYASNSIDHEDFQTPSAILTGSIFPGEGGDLIGGWIFKGRLFVFKRGGYAYYLDDSDTSSENWFFQRASSNFDLASPHSVLEATNDMLALTLTNSLISYTQTLAYGGVDNADVFKNMEISEFLRSKVALVGVQYAQAVYYELKKQLFITGRSGYKTANDLLIQIDFGRETPRASLWQKDTAVCLTLRKDFQTAVKKPIYGSTDGNVYLMDREDRLVGGSAFTGELWTPWIDFRELDPTIPSRNKLFDFLSVEYIPQGNWDLMIDVWIDGKFSETLTIPMQAPGSQTPTEGLGPGATFELGVTPLGRTNSMNATIPIHGQGRRISFHAYQSGSNQNFSLASFTVYFRLSGEQATIL